MHEILTLQFGQQANYLGTHYWNTQESYFTYAGQDESPVEHDRSFRQGLGADGTDTYTPRTLIYDLKGAFGTLRRENELYQLQNQPDPLLQNAWGRATQIRLPLITESAYQQALNSGTAPAPPSVDTVRFWSDYNHVFYHPKSIVRLNEYELNSSIMPFERFDAGEELFENLDREHDILDRDLRPFLEECDQLQCIQLVGSTVDAWGGFSAKYAERIADELGKGCRWMFALDDNTILPRSAMLRRSTNSVRSTEKIMPNVSMFVPLSVPARLPSYIDMQVRVPWTVSALQSMLMESITLPARLKHDSDGSASLSEIEQSINMDGHRPIGAASLSVVEAEDSTVTDSRMTNGLSHDDVDGLETPLDIDFLLSHGTSGRNRLYASYELQRGPATQRSLDDAVRRFDRHTELLFPLLTSFPPIVKDSGDRVCVNTAFNSAERVARYVKHLATTARSMLDVDEREAVYDSLSSLAEEYEESMAFSDDEDDDD